MTTPTDPTTTTSGLTEINGPAIVVTDGSLPADPLCVVFAPDGFCLQWDFQTTTSVAVGVPPVPSSGLPNTGVTPMVSITALLGVVAITLGQSLRRKARRV